MRQQNKTCKTTYSNYSTDLEAKYACDEDSDCYAIHTPADVHDQTCSKKNNLSLCHKSEVENGKNGGPGIPCIYRKSSISNKGYLIHHYSIKYEYCNTMAD